jgi:hypothetical protein
MRAHGNEGRLGKRFAILIGLAAAGVMALGAQTAMANSEGRTEGDARAAFNAVAGAGFTIAENGGTHAGAPIGGAPTGSPEDVRIYPNEKNGSYCASGWHVIFLAAWDSASFYDSQEALFASLSAIDMQFAWDGVPLVEERTAIKRFNIFFQDPDDPDTDPEVPTTDVFFVAHGTFMPPGTLSVGKHRLTTTVVDPDFGFNETWSVNVNILPC